MMDSEEAPGASSQETRQVELVDESLKVNIADALNEQDIVKFTVHTKTTLEGFAKKDFQVTRQHEEFVWLHDRFLENDKFAGFIIPPCPPKPDFSQSHGKLAKLQAGDPSMSQEEVEKLKQEIQAEYLAAFQKTVAMHETFLVRIATHPQLRDDDNFRVFLEFEKDLACRSRSRTEKAMDLFKTAVKAVDSSFGSFKDSDEFFERSKQTITHYNTTIALAKQASENKVKQRLYVVSAYDKLATALVHFANTQTAHLEMSEVLRRTGECQGALVVVEKKLVAKEDLKMTDLLRYYVADGLAARDLLARRVKAFKDVETANKKLEAARKSGKGVVELQDVAEKTKARFEAITKSAKTELEVFSQRRLVAFRKGLIQYTQCQIRQAKEAYTALKDTLATIKDHAAKSGVLAAPSTKPVYSVDD